MDKQKNNKKNAKRRIGRTRSFTKKGSNSFKDPSLSKEVSIYKTSSRMKPNLIRLTQLLTLTLEFLSDLVELASSSPFVVYTQILQLYDPEFGILGTTYAGFLATMLKYQEYLCQKHWAKVNLTNRTPYIQRAYLIYTQERLDTKITTWQQARDYAEQAFSTPTSVMSQFGVAGQNCTLHSDCAIQELIGKRGEYQFSALYSGAANTNASFTTFVNLVIFESSGTKDVSDGIAVDFVSSMKSEFYGATLLEDFLSFLKEHDLTSIPDKLISVNIGSTKQTFRRGLLRSKSTKLPPKYLL